MIVFAALGFIAGVLWLPFWHVFLWPFLFALFFPRGWRGALSTGAAAFCVWAASCFILSGMSKGLIATRMSALFSLPHSYLMYAGVGLIAFLAAVSAYYFGLAVRGFFAETSKA